MNKTNKFQGSDLHIKEPSQLKAIAAAINPLSSQYNPHMALEAQELNRIVRRTWQPPLELFISTLADPILSNQVTRIMAAEPGITTPEATLRVFGLSTWDRPRPPNSASTATELTKSCAYSGDDAGKEEEQKEEEEDEERKEEEQEEKGLKEVRCAIHRRRQWESDRLVDAVRALMQLHAVHNA
ncbi:hypothetical protein BGZ97_002804 [Linnemannia gamsii]|jgi:hypothetical protein|uniref:Uncharacterized protein n=1 Tax=Linnemannia gamsii TaxID=64522 RepID=A0A9P6QVH7_9FUNG|nr:hypothetical protein BGZ97_002804 [Linnemannia gamsii]